MEIRKLQKLNRIPIPTSIVNALGLKIGKEVYFSHDDERAYLAKSPEALPKMVATFDRDNSEFCMRPTPTLKGRAVEEFLDNINNDEISPKQKKFLKECAKLIEQVR